MKKKHPFEWLNEDRLMIVLVEINSETTLRFLLDTGSTHTCLDKNILYIEQISLKERVGQVEIETANGHILADVFNLQTFEVFDLNLLGHPVQVIDFIEHGILSDYSGILGMDVLSRKKLCFHFGEGYLTFG